MLSLTNVQFDVGPQIHPDGINLPLDADGRDGSTYDGKDHRDYD